MNRWIMTSAFCKEKMLLDLLDHIHCTCNLDGFRHVTIDQHYPIGNSMFLEYSLHDRILQFGSIYIDSLYDRGLHRGLNHALKTLDIQPDDIVIVCDPDDRPSENAFQALAEVMQADPTIAVAALNFSVIPMKIKDHGLIMFENTIGGHRVWEHPGVEMWNVAAYNTKLLSQIGGFSQPNAYYGGIEIALYQHWVRQGMKLVYLMDHTSEAVPVDRKDPNLYDSEYGDWKIAHATQGYKASFAQWLLDNGLQEHRS